ncbi:Variant-specific surface protein, partial [Giardia duodenalis]
VMSVCRPRWCTRTPATTHTGPHLKARRTDSGGIAAVVHPSNDMDLHPSLGGCYNTRVAPGSGVCREARDGACVMYKEGVTDRTKEPMRVREAQTGCTAETSSTDHCASGKCDVTIDGKTYCSQCEANYVPIDGTCTAVDANTKTKCKKDASNELAGTEQVCGACGDGYFLHKGGCYQFGGEVGKLICTDPSTPDSSLTAGTCTTCASGYFKNPTQAANKPPCIACNDETGDGTNKGKAGCATCEAPSSSGPATCLTCLDGYYNSGSESSVTCAECNAACATCSGDEANKCTSCKEADKYLKTDSSAGTSQCVIEAACKQGGTHFPTTTTDGKKICAPCNDAANGGIADCKTCSKSGTAVKCSACTALHLLLTREAPEQKEPNRLLTDTGESSEYPAHPTAPGQQGIQQAQSPQWSTHTSNNRTTHISRITR